MSIPYLIATEAETRLREDDTWFVLGVVVLFILAAGLVVIRGRRVLSGAPAKLPWQDDKAKPASNEGEGSLVRSWLAISLVGGLLIFTAISFWISDRTLRSTLVGGLVANAGAAVAFYFASKESDQARKDILNAGLPAVLVPDLVGKDLTGARAALAALPLTLDTTPSDAEAGWKVISQDPAANTPTYSGSAITVTLEKPTDSPTPS